MGRQKLEVCAVETARQVWARASAGMVSEDMLMERRRRAWEEDERADMENSLRREEERDLKLQVFSHKTHMLHTLGKDAGAVHTRVLAGTLFQLSRNELVWC